MFIQPNSALNYEFNSSLINSLRQGGYILYTRHGEATVGEDQPNLNLQDCSTQRNLSYEGKRQAIIYGETLRNLRIPVEYPVQVSPFCRNIETAILAFGKKNIQIDPFWVGIYKLSYNLSENEKQRILNSLRTVLETNPPLGSNKVIIGHSFPKGVGLGKISDMETIVIRPLGRGNDYEVMARIPLSELTSL